jgi:protein-tyrosine phosphatase
MASRYKQPFRHDPGTSRRNLAAEEDESRVRGFFNDLGTRANFLFDSPTAFTRPDLSKVRRLVFVCSANLIRSAFAQALCTQAGLAAASFGLYTRTGTRTFASSARAAAAMGARIDQHRARHWRDFEAEEGDLYLVMELSHARQLLRLGFPAQHIALLGHWSQPRRLQIRDAYSKGEMELRECFRLIRSAVDKLTDEMRALDPVPGLASDWAQGRPALPGLVVAAVPDAPRPPSRTRCTGAAAVH